MKDHFVGIDLVELKLQRRALVHLLVEFVALLRSAHIYVFLTARPFEPVKVRELIQ